MECYLQIERDYDNNFTGFFLHHCDSFFFPSLLLVLRYKLAIVAKLCNCFVGNAYALFPPNPFSIMCYLKSLHSLVVKQLLISEMLKFLRRLDVMVEAYNEIASSK